MRLTGAGVSPGAGHGPAYILTASVPEPPEDSAHAGDADAEKERALAALRQVADELEARAARLDRPEDPASGGPGREGADILRAQALMATDPGLTVGVEALVDEGVAAPRAVFSAFAKYRDALAGAGGYLAERVADLDDVRDRAIAVLTGHPLPGVPAEPAPPAEPGGAPRPYVLVARDLAPADTALLSRDVVAAFVTEGGGPTSHTAILARAMGVPAVVGCAGATAITPGATVLVDGSSGEVRTDVSAEDLARAASLDQARRAARARAGESRGTRDGHPVPLLANIGGPQDLDAALRNGAEGVGLYRTEFLFLGRRHAPAAEEQERAYRAALVAFPGRPVVVRALDAGADKPLAFLPPPGDEPNPALGERGLRLLRRFGDVLDAQLGALARAAASETAELQVMAPMVATAEEARWFAQACRARGLRRAGVMVEVPAAALRAASLAAEVDFLSIGTNDLAQYAFAADRELGTLGDLQDPWQPALLDLVRLAAAGAAEAARPCGVCGEAAADPALACVLVGLGVTSLSMAAAALPAVRAGLGEHTLEQCREAAEAALAATGPASARAAARACLPALDRLGL
ncbi:phosphoenolpyruvate--protein phosphotransferase [Nonomuraea rhodomycinica]|uniref:phosphoenolpyruvate--protein phosphotransferase n=1 Tax=Nonomuraea rhodomycinica TaxID=1712872 RepID=UPI0028B01535|nr:phosphoenolpyruvate--protein phosphotransferase [Nonomuraea rhodomycinica]